MEALADRVFWSEYWKGYEPRIITRKDPFIDLFDILPGPRSSFIEIGGFPGAYAVYFKKFWNYDVTLLDYLVIPEVIERVLSVNSLPPGSVNIIETDFFAYEAQNKFDVVFSVGFIEHFQDTTQVLRKHCDLLKTGGTLFVALPNFRGLNGYVQKWLDRKTYDVHNIDSMNPSLLLETCASLGLEQYVAFFYGLPQLWLEPAAPVNKATRRIVSLVSGLMSSVRLRNRLFSPWIVLIGKK